MRVTAMCFVLGAVASAGCLRSTQFKCAQNADCGTTGICETVGFCSFPNASCTDSGRSFSDSAGQGLAGTCVSGTNPPPLPDAGPMTDAPVPIDGPPAGCPSGYNPIGTSAHRYKVLTSTSWTIAANDCKLTSTSAYLAVPDDAAELNDLSTVATAPFWVGIDDQLQRGTFVTQKGATATFLPWAAGQPDQSNPPKECVNAISATEIATDKCGNAHVAVCECEP